VAGSACKCRRITQKTCHSGPFLGRHERGSRKRHSGRSAPKNEAIVTISLQAEIFTKARCYLRKDMAAILSVMPGRTNLGHVGEDGIDLGT
jgi:hypothetical protein